MRAISLAGLLTACGDTAFNDALEMAEDSLSSPRSAVDLAVVDRIPYASMGAKFVGQPQSVVVLADARRGDLRGVSPDRRMLVTRGGRVVQTAGLLKNVREVSASAETDLLAQARTGAPYRRVVDIPESGWYGVSVRCNLAVGPRERPALTYQQSQDLIRVDESCDAAGEDWTVDNTYWVSAAGEVVKSIQHVAPGLPALELEQFKPYQPG